MNPVLLFLHRFRLTAAALYLSRRISGEGWQLRREINVELFTPEQLQTFAMLGGQARGQN